MRIETRKEHDARTTAAEQLAAECGITQPRGVDYVDSVIASRLCSQAVALGGDMPRSIGGLALVRTTQHGRRVMLLVYRSGEYTFAERVQNKCAWVIDAVAEIAAERIKS